MILFICRRGIIRRDKLTKGGRARRTTQKVNLVEIEGRGGYRIDEALSDVTVGEGVVRRTKTELPGGKGSEDAGGRKCWLGRRRMWGRAMVIRGRCGEIDRGRRAKGGSSRVMRDAMVARQWCCLPEGGGGVEDDWCNNVIWRGRVHGGPTQPEGPNNLSGRKEERALANGLTEVV